MEGFISYTAVSAMGHFGHENGILGCFGASERETRLLGLNVFLFAYFCEG